MPSSLVLGNGSMLVGLDRSGLVRDLYYDYVGMENHTNGYPQRIGVFVDGRMSWLDDYGWRTDVKYLPETLVGHTVAQNDELGLRITFEDFVYNETSIFTRKIAVENLSDREREIRIFFHQDLPISGHTFGVTAFYYPQRQCLIHYCGPRMFLFNGQFEQKSMHDFSIGMTRYAGLAGTWKDAEDGVLSGNPIEHGSVDSVMAFHLTMAPQSTSKGYIWMAAGKTLDEVTALNDDIVLRTPDHLLKSTSDYWSAWVNKQNYSFFGLSYEQIQLFKTSLLVMRVHADNRGSIIASSDSAMLQHGKDTYAYMWPRDGAHIAIAFAKAGYWDTARKFFEFTVPLITPEGYLMHKYLSDGSLGSSWHAWVKKEEKTKVLPIQEDETAVILHALWVYYETSRDIEFIEEIYNSFIKKAANFLVTYRNEKTGLPLHSYDLWEEQRVLSTYTAACVVGGLDAAARFAELLGKSKDAVRYTKASGEVREGIHNYLTDKKLPLVFKSVRFSADGSVVEDRRIDASSFYSLLAFDVFPLKNPFVPVCARDCETLLWEKTPIGGMARYEGDTYYQVVDGVANPWIITTIWRTSYMIRNAQNERDMEPVKAIFQWVVDRALSSGILPEQVHPITGAALSATPLVWSHAEYVRAVIEYLEKLDELGIAPATKPI